MSRPPAELCQHVFNIVCMCACVYVCQCVFIICAYVYVWDIYFITIRIYVYLTI